MVIIHLSCSCLSGYSHAQSIKLIVGLYYPVHTVMDIVPHILWDLCKVVKDNRIISLQSLAGRILYIVKKRQLEYSS